MRQALILVLMTLVSSPLASASAGTDLGLLPAPAGLPYRLATSHELQYREVCADGPADWLRLEYNQQLWLWQKFSDKMRAEGERPVSFLSSDTGDCIVVFRMPWVSPYLSPITVHDLKTGRYYEYSISHQRFFCSDTAVDVDQEVQTVVLTSLFGPLNGGY